MPALSFAAGPTAPPLLDLCRAAGRRGAGDRQAGAARALRHVIALDRWPEFLAEGDARGGALPQVQPLDAAMIQYTSGTTGFPKGALLHHRGLVNNAALVLDRMELPEAPVWIGTTPLFHTGCCGLAVLGVVSKLGRQVLVESFDPALVLASTHQHWGEVVAAFILPAAGQRVDKALLDAWLREQIAFFKLPRHWFELQASPLTGSGKIQKFKLRQM